MIDERHMATCEGIRGPISQPRPDQVAGISRKPQIRRAPHLSPSTTIYT